MNIKAFGMAAVGAVAIGLSIGSMAPAEAATLSADRTQILGLDVSGTLYDVKFEDGSYDQVFAATGRTPTFLGDLTGATNAATAIANFLNSNPGNEIIPGALFSVADLQVIQVVYELLPNRITAQSATSDSSGQSWQTRVIGTNSDGDIGVFAVFASANATPIPTPALLPGLLGLGVAALRKRKGETTESGAEPIKA